MAKIKITIFQALRAFKIAILIFAIFGSLTVRLSRLGYQGYWLPLAKNRKMATKMDKIEVGRRPAEILSIFVTIFRFFASGSDPPW